MELSFISGGGNFIKITNENIHCTTASGFEGNATVTSIHVDEHFLTVYDSGSEIPWRFHIPDLKDIKWS